MTHTDRLKVSASSFRLLTGITPEAFDALLAELTPRYEQERGQGGRGSGGTGRGLGRTGGKVAAKATGGDAEDEVLAGGGEPGSGFSPRAELGARLAAWAGPPAGGPAGSNTLASAASVTREAHLSRFGTLARLPGTRGKVRQVFRTLTGSELPEGRDDVDDGKVVALLSGAASAPRLYREAAGARYLHLATHGLVESGERACFSCLALAMPAAVTSRDTGLLTLSDLFNQWWGRLGSTELVVLSACNSLGAEKPGENVRGGEGVFGLPWGFMYAGSTGIVASLWAVNDASTEELMGGLYAAIEQQREDKLKAFVEVRKALRKRYPNPYHWGPFIFIGAPR